MELTVYRQSSKVRPDGTTVYKGEDARPLVNDRLLLVADGLGGAAAIRHQNIAPDLFDPETLPDKLFKGVFEDYSDPDFLQYVKDSFFELFAVKDIYTDNVNNIKKSGYFASRIASAILYHEILRDPEMQPEKLFELMEAAAGSEEQKKKTEAAIGEHLAERMLVNLRKIAENCHLSYESSYSGLALLGTTLCATLFKEGEEKVDALYFTAGDSRPYLWTGEEGLSQLLPDEEGEDGGMTNYIKANEDAAFHIRCTFFSFPKPCVLFNASDGCFDSGYFLSQLAFEKLILSLAGESNTPEELGGKLYEFFLDYGRHDDSSTIAMKFFGFPDFDAFRAAAGERLKVLEERFFSKLPELLERDFASEAAEEKKAKAEAEKAEAAGEEHNVIGSSPAGEETVSVEEPERTEEKEEKEETAAPVLTELEEKAALQKALFEEYQVTYGRFMGDNA